MKIAIYISLAVVVTFGIYISLFFWIIPAQHDASLQEFSSSLLSVPAPENGQIEASLSKVGLQVGNGDHCDYLAALAIQSKMAKKDLQDYYEEEYKGKSKVQYVWLDESSSYTSTTSPDTIFSLKDWVQKYKDSANVVVYIFEPSMTSSFDYRCS
jgi:hypothetical protein